MEHEVPDHDPHCVKCGRHVPHGVYRKLVERYYFLGFAVRTKTRWVQFYCINCLHEIDPKEYPVVRVSGNGRSLTETVDRVSLQYDEAIVLTDWDSQGDTLSVKLKSLLESHGVVPRTQHRRRLRHLTSKDIHDVESLASHRHNIESEL